MPQGKLKVKTKLLQNTKTKNKGPVATKRTNRPIQPKKKKLETAQKMKQKVSKALNKAVEEEMRNRAYDTSKKLSKAQEAVAAHNAAGQQGTASTTTT